MKGFFKNTIDLFKKTYIRWIQNDPFVQSAVIAYYTLFSLPSLLVIIIGVSSLFFNEQAVTQQITKELGNLIGEGAAHSIRAMIERAEIDQGSTLAIIIGIGVLIFAATGAFFQLKKAMNKIWSVREKRTDVWGIALNRAISFGMVMVIGLLLLVALIVSALIAGLSQYISQLAPEFSEGGLVVLNFFVSYLFIGLLFAAVFKVLPDIKIPWKTTLTGASVTTLLFLIGEFGLTFYVANANPTSIYGGASSVVLILLWVYYTCMILFFGAEFTFQYATFSNANIRTDRFGELSVYEESKELKDRIERYKKHGEPLEEFSEEELERRMN